MKLDDIFAIIFTRQFTFLSLAALSAFSLMMALIAQYVFGLAPCPLCIYQRIPFVIAIILGGIGFYFEKRVRDALSTMTLGLMGLNFAVNTAIASFHTGVERKWWKGLEGCSAPDLSGSIDDILKRIEQAPIVRCDEIPWADPLIGLSMANYNAIMCFCIVIYCIIVFAKRA